MSTDPHNGELSQRTPGSTVRLTDQELAEAAALIEEGDGDLITEEVILALIGEVRVARTQRAEWERLIQRLARVLEDGQA